MFRFACGFVVVVVVAFSAEPGQNEKNVAFRQAKDEQADAVKKRIRQWESENRVLGHHARSDVHRPRALLVLSGMCFGGLCSVIASVVLAHS